MNPSVSAILTIIIYVAQVQTQSICYLSSVTNTISNLCELLSLRVHRLILDGYPDAAKEKNMLGFLPLQSCIKHKVQDTDLLIAVLTANPHAASVPDDHRRVTLHYAASRNMAPTFVQALLTAYAHGARVPDKNEQIPLHLAVTRLDDITLINLLLQAHPGGVLDADRYNMVPLNYAVENDAGMGIMEALLRTNVKCAEHCYLHNKTVLHQAVEFRRTVEVIQALVAAYPGATRLQEAVAGNVLHLLYIHEYYYCSYNLRICSCLCMDKTMYFSSI